MNSSVAAEAGSASTPALTLRGVVKRWPGQAEPVLRGVELSLSRSTVVAIHGRNGAGKTTLLRIAAGILLPDEGEVSIGGITAVGRREFQSRIGFVSAGNTALYARLTVDHHLDLCSRLALMPRGRRDQAVEAARVAFDLDKLRGRRVDRLSTGQRQRLRLALGFLHRPDVVLLDEPDSSLDDEALEHLAAALDGVKARGGAAIVCSPSGFGDRLRVDRSIFVTAGLLVDA